MVVEGRFEYAMKKERPEAVEGEKMDKTHSETEEELVIGATPGEEIVPGNLGGYSDTIIGIAPKKAGAEAGKRTLKDRHGVLE